MGRRAEGRGPAVKSCTRRWMAGASPPEALFVLFCAVRVLTALE